VGRREENNDMKDGWCLEGKPPVYEGESSIFWRKIQSAKDLKGARHGEPQPFQFFAFG
jgi:hypothetical protein